jgi:hypothetical protein
MPGNKVLFHFVAQNFYFVVQNEHRTFVCLSTLGSYGEYTPGAGCSKLG